MHAFSRNLASASVGPEIQFSLMLSLLFSPSGYRKDATLRILRLAIRFAKLDGKGAGPLVERPGVGSRTELMDS